MPSSVETDFINLVKITEVKDIDYVIHLLNTYTGKAWVFKIYKELFDKAMEVRTINNLDVTITSDKEEEEKKKSDEKKKKIASVYV